MVGVFYVCRTVCEWQLSNSQQPPMQMPWTKCIQFLWHKHQVIQPLTCLPTPTCLNCVFMLVSRMWECNGDTKLNEQFVFPHRASIRICVYTTLKSSPIAGELTRRVQVHCWLHFDKQLKCQPLHVAVLCLWELGFPVWELILVGCKMYCSCMCKA